MMNLKVVISVAYTPNYFDCAPKNEIKTTTKLVVVFMDVRISLASSYFDRGQPPNYRRRASVSQPSSGRDRSGATRP
jgi:hypothetical protein